MDNNQLIRVINRVLDHHVPMDYNRNGTICIDRWVRTWAIQKELRNEHGIDWPLSKIRYECNKLIHIGEVVRSPIGRRSYYGLAYSVTHRDGCLANGHNYFEIIKNAQNV